MLRDGAAESHAWHAAAAAPWRANRLASAAVPRPGELAAGRPPPRGSTVAAAQYRANPGPGWA